MSIIPNSVTPHAVSITPSIGSDLTANLTDRLTARAKSVPTGAWIAGAAALGVAAAAAVSLWERPQPKKRVTVTRRPRRKSASASRRRAAAA